MSERPSFQPAISHPKVSVCIPTWNRAHYLRATIVSVLEQDFGDFEVIVSDDGSCDQTADVVKSISDSRVRYARNSTRLGLWGNTSRCLEKAAGAYVIILQDDDAMRQGLLRREVEVLESEGDVVLVHAAAERVDSDGRPIDVPPQSWPARTAGLDFVRGYWTGAEFAVAMSSAMFRRTVAAELGNFNEALLFSADADLWQRMAFVGRVAFLDRPLIATRVHPGQVTSKILVDHGRMLRERLEHVAVTRKLLAAHGANLDALISGRLSCYVASDLVALRSLDCSFAQVLRYAFAGLRVHPAVLGSLSFYRSLLVAMLPPAMVRSVKRMRGRWRHSSGTAEQTGMSAKTAL